MAWSMRTPPACRMQARSVAMKGANPPATSARGENVVSPQFWPLVLNKSGGAPICRPTSTSFCSLQAALPRWIHADRKIGDEADAHAGIVIFCCAAAKERSAIHCRNEWNRISRSFSLGKFAHRATLRIAPMRRPVLPIPVAGIGPQCWRRAALRIKRVRPVRPRGAARNCAKSSLNGVRATAEKSS